MMSDFFIKRNADSVVSFNYQRLIQLSGGQTKAVEFMQKTFDKYDSDSMKVLSIKYGKPSKMIYYQGLYQCTIPQTMVMQNKNKQIEAKSTLIALSTDNGNKWYFFDAGSQKLSDIRAMLLEVSSELDISESNAKIIKDSN